MQDIHATVHVELTGYSTPYDQSMTIPAGSSASPCVNPTPTLNVLYGLANEVPGQVEAKVTVDGNAVPVLDDVHAVTITTGQTAFNAASTNTTPTPLYRDQAVFSMPKDPQVQSLLAPIAARSRWGTFNEGGYNMHLSANGGQQFMNAVTSTVPSRNFVDDHAYFQPRESISVVITDVTCAGLCTSASIDFYAISDTAFMTFQNNLCNAAAAFKQSGLTAVVSGPSSETGAQFTITAPSTGWYHLIFFNNCANLTTRGVTYKRTGTQADTVIDTLGAVYDQLKSQGITYVNVASSFFDPTLSQTIRWPATALTDKAANCVDGSMLFASLVEAIQLEPVVVYVSGHAFMGVRQSPGNALVWPVETTMLGTNTFTDAFNERISEYNTDMHLADLDIKAARTAGLLPIPE